MLEALLALLVVAASFLLRRRMTSNAPCPPTTDEERVQFLLTMLVEARWSNLCWKLLWRHRHHRGHMSVVDQTAAGSRAAPASSASATAAPSTAASPAVDPLGLRLFPANSALLVEQPEIPPAARIPLCPDCGRPMVVRRNRVNHGAFWGCQAWPMCRGTRRPWDTGDDPQRH